MHDKIDNDEIDLKQIVGDILQHKKIIILITTLSFFIVMVFSIISIKMPPETSPLPNKYKSSVYILINESQMDGVSSILSSSGLGSLASMVGVSGMQGASNVGLARYIMESNSMLDTIIKHFDLTERYKIKKHRITNTRNKLKKNLISTYNEETGIFSISYTDINPIFAKDVVNYAVTLLNARFNELNLDTNKITKANLNENITNSYNKIISLQKEIQDLEKSVSNVYDTFKTPSIVKDTAMMRLELDAQKEIYKQLKAQDELIKIEAASQRPVFQILDWGEASDMKIGPSRSSLCITVTTVSFIFSIFFAYIMTKIKAK